MTVSQLPHFCVFQSHLSKVNGPSSNVVMCLVYYTCHTGVKVDFCKSATIGGIKCYVFSFLGYRDFSGVFSFCGLCTQWTITQP